MHNSVIIFVLALVACSVAQETSFELANDPDYPQHVVIKDVQYNIMPGEYVDINCTVVIYEDIDVGTNVSAFAHLGILASGCAASLYSYCM